MARKRKYEDVPVGKLNLLDPGQFREFERRATQEEKDNAKKGFEALAHMLRNV